MTYTSGDTGQPPAGWYPDPYDRSLQRWWDGARWAESTKAIWQAQPTSVVSRQSISGKDPGPRHAASDKGRFRGDLSEVQRVAPPSRRGHKQHNLNMGSSSIAPYNETVLSSPRSVDEHRKDNLTRLALSATFGISLILFISGYALDISVLRLLGLAGALFFGIGSAPLQLSEYAPLDMRLAVACIVGLSIPLITGSLMVLIPLWHPFIAAVVIIAIAVGVHIAACYRAIAQLPKRSIFRWINVRNAHAFDVSIVCSLVGTLLWCASAIDRGNIVPGVLGFLPRISIFWYIGLFLVLAGIALAIGNSEPRMIFGVVSLQAALTLTPAIIYGMPSSQSAAKHIDLVQLILQTHHLNREAGIFQAYSGQFSGVAWLCDLGGIRDPTALATYWPFLISLIIIVELRFFFGRLSTSWSQIWAVITLVILVNSIGADYFSPQSVGFALGLGVFGLAVGGECSGLGRRGRIAILLLAGCSMAITHELSPYIVGGVLVVLVLFRTIRPWYVPATCLIPAFLWTLLNRHVLSGFLSLAELGNLSNFAPPKTVSSPGLQRLPIVGESSHALTLGLLALIALAVIGFVRNIRDKSAWAFMISVSLGLFLIAANPYGNEGIFRAALFGIPWLAAVGMRALPANPPRWTSVVYGSAAVSLTATYLVATFGLDNANVIRPADFDALRTYQAEASPNSYLLTLSYGDLPQSVTIPSTSDHFVEWNSVIEPARVIASKPSSDDAEVLARQYIQYARHHGGTISELYAIWSPACASYAVDYGLESLSQAEAWRSLVIASPDWHVVYRSDGTYLFRVVVNAGTLKGS